MTTKEKKGFIVEIFLLITLFENNVRECGGFFPESQVLTKVGAHVSRSCVGHIGKLVDVLTSFISIKVVISVNPQIFHGGSNISQRVATYLTHVCN